MNGHALPCGELVSHHSRFPELDVRSTPASLGPQSVFMSQETVVYTVNLIIGLILAGVMSQHWRLQAGGLSLRYWIIAAWVLTFADLLFVLRGSIQLPLVRALPTIVVTAGHAMLLLAAQQVTGREPMRRVATSIVVLHALLLLFYIAVPTLSGWRTVTNGIIWGGLAMWAAAQLWESPNKLTHMLKVPAIVLAGQGGFHAMRITLATQAIGEPGSGLAPLVQMLGDLEVSLFMVSLFVSVLVAFLRQSNDDLRLALDNVRQLSSMLPVCAWCNKVRDEDGYWQRVEQYLATHKVSVTHALCESCAEQQFAELERQS